jgi:Flp pilus assembly protein TadD
MANYHLGNFTNAVHFFECAIEYDPTNHQAWHKKGVSKYMLGLKNEACEDLRMAIELGNKDAYSILKVYCRGDVR